MLTAGAVRRPVHQRSIRNVSDTDPLPDIVGRLAKLEAANFSYDDLLLDFASRRHLNPVNPVEERSVGQVGRAASNPAEEADDIVQAYLSPTQYDNLSTSSTTWASGGNTRAPRALLGSSTVNIVQRKNQQPHENVIQHDRTPPFWHKIDNRFERPAEGGGILEDQFMPSRKGDALSFMIDTIEAPSKSDLQVLTCEPFRPLASDSGRGVFDPSTIQTTDQDDNNLEGYVAVTRKETHIPSRQREAGESRRPRPRRPSSLGSYPEQDSLINWYPSRPASAETASVSLISPRTSKKIRRLPTPGQIEEDTLQRVERAIKTFSSQALGLRKRGGLYSTLGRSDVGFIEADIIDLTATAKITARTDEATAAAKHGVNRGKSLARRSDGVLAQLLGPKENVPLPTVYPAPFYDLSKKPRPREGTIPTTRESTRSGTSEGTRPGTREGLRPGARELSSRVSSPGSPSRPPPLLRKPLGQTKRGNALDLKEDVSSEGLEMSGRVTVHGADGLQHRKHLDRNVRRLRALLGERFETELGGRPSSPSPFSVDELRTLGAAKRRRWAREKDIQGGGRTDIEQAKRREETQEEEEGRVTAELSHNIVLKNLAMALMCSVQSRAEREFLRLGFRKWKAVIAQGTLLRYLDATVLIQSCIRRTLAILEASDRRRLRENQRQRARNSVAQVVRRRQEAALKLQAWIRGERGRQRATGKRRKRHAALMVQRNLRAKAARALACARREEAIRCRDAEAIARQREREENERDRLVLERKARELAIREALFQQRCDEIELRFRREGAAVRIQALWRAGVLKHNLSAFVRIGKRTRAIRIQRMVRGVLAQRELRRRKEAFQIRFQAEIAAAIKIQSLARRGIAWNRADDRRFDRNKNQLVSTMDAERALRSRRHEVPFIKALAAREGILAAENKGQPYTIDPVALQVYVTDKKRQLNFWQESTDRKAATKIQALWRGYRQVVRVRRMRVRQRREKAEKQRIQKIKAANNLQRVFRGSRARLTAKSRRYGLRAVRVQKVWRGFLGRRSAADRRQHVQAAILLQRRLRGAQARSLAARLRREAVTTSVPAITIQAAARRCLARKLRRRLATERQIEWEWKTMAKELARFCAERARLRVIVEGALATSCRGDGVTQFIFRKLAVKRSGETGSKSFRLEGRAFAKLLAGVPGLCNSLFRATDIDLIFARVKDKDEKTITYVQFSAGLNVIAATRFPETKRFKDFEAFKGKAARLLELVEGCVLKAPNSAEYRKFCQKSGERYLYRSAVKMQAVVRGRLGRKRSQRTRGDRAREKRSNEETAAAITMQALGRRYCGRCRAIRLARARIAKFIDPASNLPYWVHPGTGITAWTKPKIFGADDVEQAITVATSRTEHLVKCSVCDDAPVKRLCTSCRDSYCEECFQSLHGKGRRRTHVAPTVHMCCVCKYQHGSRLCETCTFKTSSTCAYCDVCFFATHPGLDPTSKAGAGGTKWGSTTSNRETGWNHSWTPLVVICVECRRYAARWLCDDCEDVYCVACYTSVHQHGTRVYHGAEKLPYYTVDFHMEYAMACRKRGRAQREEDAHILWSKEQEQGKQRAATVIQAGWRGRVGRIEGRAHLQAGRFAQREAWRQRKRDDHKRKALWYSTLDLAGLAPQLKSDTIDEKVLRKVPRLARARPRKYIALNREDDAWVPGKLDGRKGTTKRGFEVGEMSELKDQAKRGGVRLPGRHSVKTAHRCIYTDPTYDMKALLKPKNVIRVQGEIFNVEAVLDDRIRVDRVWARPDAEGLLMFKMVLNPRQKLTLRATRAFWSSQAVQYGIQGALLFEEDVINRCLKKAAKYYKKKRQKRLYGLTKAMLKREEANIRKHKLMLNTAQQGLDIRPITAAPGKENEAIVPSDGITPSVDADFAWSEIFDEVTCRPVWHNSVTGEVCLTPPAGVKEKMHVAEELAEQREALRAKMAAKKKRK